jgi:hypothetical protein
VSQFERNSRSRRDWPDGTTRRIMIPSARPTEAAPYGVARHRRASSAYNTGKHSADWIYCGSASQVPAAGTQSLLRAYEAIWCSPPRLRPWPGTPKPGERLWLLWRQSPSDPVLLLGGGRIVQAPRNIFHTNLLWTNADVPGVADQATRLGYTGPTNMSFLRLKPVVFPVGGYPQPIRGNWSIETGLNIATPSQVAALSHVSAII